MLGIVLKDNFLLSFRKYWIKMIEVLIIEFKAILTNVLLRLMILNSSNKSF